MTNWKERHETFIDAVSSSKKVDYAIKTGAPLPPPPRTAIPSDYVQCNYCGRNFSEKAAERHIPFCKEQNARKMTSSSTKSFPGYRKTPSKNETRGHNSAGTAPRRVQDEPPPSQHARRKEVVAWKSCSNHHREAHQHRGRQRHVSKHRRRYQLE
ncbi:hypothetical protein OESDEN_05351 [Oesophagostomum dentatum]|uniref:C2HC/C3H-type domain-containing protein n=1 Tax=Oesophagostomum dentatum TaxID=61180 RepID=A0A0B1TF44_OESDE|nr:hypothetical protein OESDEN_05351 [Oesophagostomum dentatum]